MKILFLSRWFPFPPNNGSRIRIYNLLRGLSQLHEVTLFSFYDPKETSIDPSTHFPFCSRVELVPWKPFESTSRKATIGLFSLAPRSLLDTHSSQMEALISKAALEGQFDLIIASQLTMASYFPVFGGVPAIFEELELGLFFDQAYKNGNWKSRLRLRLTWFKLRQYLSRLLDSFAACTVVSEQEAQLLTENLPRHAHKARVLPNGINLGDFEGLKVQRNGHRIVYSGSFRYEPNYQAMRWFVGEVFPLVLEQIPDAELVITGDHANLPLPHTKNVNLAGYVDDIKSLVASCDVSIAPLWSGGGTRLKILEAMALGTPVVATTKGAEGLLVQDGIHLLLADEPKKFAQHVIHLMSDRALSEALSANALGLIRDCYDWPVLMPEFLRLVDSSASG